MLFNFKESFSAARLFAHPHDWPKFPSASILAAPDCLAIMYLARKLKFAPLCPLQVKKDEDSKADADKPKAEEADRSNVVEQTKPDSSVKEEADTDMKDADAASQDGVPEVKSEGKDVKDADKQKEVSKEEPQEKIPERPVLQLHGKLSTSGLTPIMTSQCVLWWNLLNTS